MNQTFHLDLVPMCEVQRAIAYLTTHNALCPVLQYERYSDTEKKTNTVMCFYCKDNFRIFIELALHLHFWDLAIHIPREVNYWRIICWTIDLEKEK